jgi:hypothetical protein
MRIMTTMAMIMLSTAGAAQPERGAPKAASPATAQSVDAKAVVAEVRRLIAANYVMPELRPALDKVLADGLALGRYDTKDPARLASLIDADLARVGQDGHLNISYDPQRPPRPGPGPMAGPPSEADIKAMEAEARAMNHGVRALRLLPGNVRYMDLALFAPGGEETEAAHAAAMKFLAGGDAVIIDLRYTPGGSPAAVRYMASHFIEPGRHLVTFKQAGEPDGIGESLPEVPNRMLGKPLYVLTSKGSASAAEEFVGHIAGFKVGEIVGETTAGAAFNNHLFDIPGGFTLSVSFGRPVLASTGKDWEKVGIAPSIPAPVLRALEAAHAHALRRLAASAPAERKVALEGMAEGVAASVEARKPALPLTAYSGRYAGAAIDLDDGRLYYRREGRAPLRMLPLGDHRFTLEDNPGARLVFNVAGSAISGFEFGRSDGPVLTRYERVK